MAAADEVAHISEIINGEERYMLIKWLGQSCFVLDTGLNKIVIDPYAPMGGYGELDLTAARLYISHQHGDHNNADCVTLVRWDDNDKICSMEEIKSYHDDVNGTARGENIIHIFNYTVKKIRIAHLGDLGHMLDGEALEAVKGCDVMIVPVGGFFTIDGAQAAELVKAASPKVVIPMHYHFGNYGPPMISGVEPFLEAIKDSYDIKQMGSDILDYSEDTPGGVYVLKYSE